MSLKAIKYDKQIDFMSEGYITQLAESLGKKVQNIVPHTFTYNLKKDTGVIPVLTSSFEPSSQRLFVGMVSYNTVIGSAEPDLGISLNGIVNTFEISKSSEYRVFDSIVNTYNMASVNTNVFNLSIHFVGYLIITSG